MRALIVNGRKFKFIVGFSRVKIVSPDGRVFTPGCAEVKGVSEATFERGQWKKTTDGMVMPREIVAWIKRHVRVKEPSIETPKKLRRKISHERKSRRPASIIGRPH
jgi:hypothetical protein